MQTALSSLMEKNDQIAPLVAAAGQGRQTFDLPQLITDFCSWYQGRLADTKQQLNLTISPDIPRYIQGDQIFMKHLLFELGKSSLLYTGTGDVQVEINVVQQTSRRYSLKLTISIPGTTMPVTRQKELFQAIPRGEQRQSCRFRAANLYYAQMIAARMGGSLHIDNGSAGGLRYLVGINVFTRPS